MSARILVIDDDPVVRGMLAEMLRREGYDVDEAEDGRAGMKQFREHPTALVITDVLMPEQEAGVWDRTPISTRRGRWAPTRFSRSRLVARSCSNW